MDAATSVAIRSQKGCGNTAKFCVDKGHVMLNSHGRSEAPSEQRFCSVWSEHIPMANRGHCHSQGCSEEQEKLLPKIGTFDRDSRDVFFSCMMSLPFASPLQTAMASTPDGLRCHSCYFRKVIPTQAAQARNQAARSSAPANDWMDMVCVNFFFFFLSFPTCLRRGRRNFRQGRHLAS